MLDVSTSDVADPEGYGSGPYPFDSPSLRPPWRVLLAAVLVCIVAVLVGAQAAVAVEFMKDEEWQAISEVEFRDPLLLPETVAVTLQSPSIWHPVAEREGISDEDFQKHYETGVAGGTQIIQVGFVDTDPDRARRITDAVVNNYVERFATKGGEDQTAAIDEYIESLRDLEESIVANLAVSDQLATATQIELQSQLVNTRGQINTMTLRLAQQETEQLERTKTDPRIVSSGFVLEQPVTPAPFKAAVFGGVAGGLIGVLFAYLAFHSTAGGGVAGSPPMNRGSARLVGGDSLPPSTVELRIGEPIGSRRSLFTKRSIDVTLSTLALVLALPLLLLLAVLVRLTSPGPAFFRQERVGKNGSSFQMLKLRTMYRDNDDSVHRAHIEQLVNDEEPDVQAGGGYKLRDPRVTAVGHYLRRLSLDELPQLWNVLKGDMSLVGPRPAMAWEYRLFGETHLDRLRTWPGCSGLWQVSGRSLVSTRHMLDLDIEYVHNWSLGRDLLILARTPLVVLRGDGAK